MAWPSTPLTTYASGTTPAIKAADLNSLQSGVNGIVNATYSLAAVVIDGTGGSVVSPIAGTCRVSASASGTSTPTTQVTWGTMFKEAALFGGAEVSGAGSFVDGYNVLSATRTGAGVYEVIFRGQPTNINRCRVAALSFTNGAAVLCTCESVAVSGTDTLIQINTWDAAGAAVDARFFVNVWGG